MVRLTNGATMESSHTADLDILELNAAAYKAHVFPGMAHHSLLSVGQLCDEGYIDSPARHSHNLQFRERQTIEWSSR
jgi:hypothetical protein